MFSKTAQRHRLLPSQRLTVWDGVVRIPNTLLGTHKFNTYTSENFDVHSHQFTFDITAPADLPIIIASSPKP